MELRLDWNCDCRIVGMKAVRGGKVRYVDVRAHRIVVLISLGMAVPCREAACSGHPVNMSRLPSCNRVGIRIAFEFSFQF